MRVIFCTSIKRRIPHKRKPSEEGFVMTAASPPGFPVRIVPGALGQSQGVASLDV